MENFNGLNEHTPLSVSLLRNQVADYFQPPVLSSFFTSENETEKLALRMMGLGGQRIRPLLAVLAYQAYSVEVFEKIQQQLALVIECFHKASLVHDDIEDDEEFRYDQPVLHRTDGIPTAINVGDYLIGKGYRLLSQIQLKPAVLADCLAVVSESHIKLAEGQGADILLNSQITEKTVADVLQIFRLKTGEAVKVALLLGAIAGGAPQNELNSLRNFSEYFGTAYQIRDDLNEFREKKSAGNLFDYPFLLALLQDKMNAVDHEFPRILSENNLSLFRKNVEKFDIENQTEHFLQEYVNKCYAELDNLQNQKMRLGLYSIMGKVFKEQKSGQ
jgi:geranylgeranyl diphosphate synthase, type II